jgi:hypothetical protein
MTELTDWAGARRAVRWAAAAVLVTMVAACGGGSSTKAGTASGPAPTSASNPAQASNGAQPASAKIKGDHCPAATAVSAIVGAAMNEPEITNHLPINYGCNYVSSATGSAVANVSINYTGHTRTGFDSDVNTTRQEVTDTIAAGADSAANSVTNVTQIGDAAVLVHKTSLVDEEYYVYAFYGGSNLAVFAGVTANKLNTATADQARKLHALAIQG